MLGQRPLGAEPLGAPQERLGVRGAITPTAIMGSTTVSAAVHMNPLRITPATINGSTTVSCVLTLVTQVPAPTYPSMFIDGRGIAYASRGLWNHGMHKRRKR